MAVLPSTTAWAGTIAVVAYPMAWVVAAAVVEGPPEALQFLVILVPPLMLGVVAAFAFGLAAGAIAALPDWWLRRRRPSRVGSVAAVTVLTLLVTGTWGAVATLAPLLMPFSVPTQVVIVGIATAVATTIVVVVERSRQHRRERSALPASPASEHR